MRILYDTQIFLSQKAGGISRYHYELLKGMHAASQDVRLAGRFIKNKYLLADQKYRKSFFNDPTASFAWIDKMMIKMSIRNASRYDLYHPSMDGYFLENNIPDGVKVVFTIHDMIFKKMGLESGETKLYFAQRADKIIAVSETTKKDIVELLGIEKEKVEVIYHGNSLFPECAELARNVPANLPEKYLLYVGNRDHHKNFVGFVRAVAPMLKGTGMPSLVCAGKRGFSKDEQHLLNECGIQNKVLACTNIDDNDLAYLYTHALAFVFPSLDEGFGIPILEAWSCGTPVILSNNACFTEIASDAGCYFDPLNPESIRESVGKVLNSRLLREELIEKGRIRLQLFSWDTAVRKTLDVYQSLFR